MHLLHQKTEPLTDGLLARRRQRLAEVVQVAPEADQLLVDVPLLSQVGDLSGQPVLVCGVALHELRHRLAFSAPRAREQVDRQVIRKALARTEGNISGSAKLLGVSRPTLYDLLKQYDLQN